MAWLRLKAVNDLLQRYRYVFSQVWKRRHQLDSEPRQSYEAQFLPAALAIQETPVSAAPRIAAWLIMLFALIALLWSIFGKIDIVATAQGKIVPNERTKVIQPFETANIKAIYVRDGQTVQVGQLLIDLDATVAIADKERILADLSAMRSQAIRSQALWNSLKSGTPPTLTQVPNFSAQQQAQMQQLLESQFAEYQAKYARIMADLTKRRAEERSTLEAVRKLEKTVPIARQRAADYQKLVSQNFVSQHGFLEREQAFIEQEGDLATQRSRLHELHASLQEGQKSLEELSAQTKRAALDSLNEAQQKIAELNQELIKAKNRDNLMQLRAPVSGTVQQLAIHTVGGVVTPAQALMVIVPKDESLEVEAFLENKDIGFVYDGQNAEIKVETFPYTKYGMIDGSVVHVSNDAINDEKRGLIYAARIKMHRSTIQVENKKVNLSPGMAVTVEIKTGTRRVIEYFLSPLLRYSHESISER